MDAYKDAGIKRVKFGTLSDANETAIRLGCGRALIVPVDVKLSQTKFDKMIDAAEGKNGKTTPKLSTSPRPRLAIGLSVAAKGIQWDDPKIKTMPNAVASAMPSAPTISRRSAIGGKTSACVTLTKTLKQTVPAIPDGAAAAIVAAKAVAKLYAAYNDGIGKKMPRSVIWFPIRHFPHPGRKKRNSEAYINGHEDIFRCAKCLRKPPFIFSKRCRKLSKNGPKKN